VPRSLSEVTATADNYRVLPGYRRFNQKHNTIMRSVWDPVFAHWSDRNAATIGRHVDEGDPGFDHFDYAFLTGAATVNSSLGTSVNGPDSGLKSWSSLAAGHLHAFPVPELRLEAPDPADMCRRVERVARYFGADLVGFTDLDTRWLYSHHYLPRTGENPPVEIPEGCDQVIVMGVELARDLMQTAPTAVMTGETSLNYSRMALLVASVAEFIRTLGYTAIPSMNDTALSIPLAVDAGLGQPSRAGFAITPRYGPRVRWCKVITDLPLDAHRHQVDFGVIEFCQVCRRCADECPAKALPVGERTTEGLNISNNPGVLKWYADYERCRRHWATLGTNCGICMRVCPFNEGRGFHHEIARGLVRLKVRSLNRLLACLHRWLRLGRRRHPGRFWSES
jgi:epoxyqueuosine reductase